MNPELKLCYIDGAWAYFTTRALGVQNSDDWNDAPYEHNAGAPYEWGKYDAQCGNDPWQIVKLAYDSPTLETPEGRANGNSSYSVDMINEGLVPWLATYYTREAPRIKIMAGCDIWEFTEKVIASGGMVYWPFDKIGEQVPR